MSLKKIRNKENTWALPQLGKKTQNILIGALIVLIAFLLWSVFFGSNSPGELPPEAISEAIYNTFAAPTYRFTTEATVFLGGEHRLFCQLNGETAGQNRHIAGELLGTPINIYLMEGALYQQSALDKSWRQVAEADLEEARKLVGEIAPESNFNYAALGAITDEGEEKIEGQTLRKLKLQPTLADAWTEQHFTDIEATLWLDESGKYLLKAQTSAVSKENPTVKLIIDNTFSSLGEALEMKAPL